MLIVSQDLLYQSLDGHWFIKTETKGFVTFQQTFNIQFILLGQLPFEDILYTKTFCIFFVLYKKVCNFQIWWYISPSNKKIGNL